MAQSVDTFRDPRAAGFSALEAAIYSRDMLLSLKSIAARQGQNRLADLWMLLPEKQLGLRIPRLSQRNDTRFPAWRSTSPANSKSSITAITTPAGALQRLMSSSISIGLGASSSTTARRRLSSGRSI